MIMQLIEVKSLPRYFKLGKLLYCGRAKFKTELSRFVPVISSNLKLRVELLVWLKKINVNNAGDRIFFYFLNFNVSIS